MSRAFVYILRCADGTLYTGYTVDLDRRLKQHRNGNGGRYTHTRTPVELVYFERCDSRREAMRRELEIKRLPRAKKLLLIKPTPRNRTPSSKRHKLENHPLS
jgi:putative endonuclease